MAMQKRLIDVIPARSMICTWSGASKGKESGLKNWELPIVLGRICFLFSGNAVLGGPRLTIIGPFPLLCGGVPHQISCALTAS